VRVGQRGLASRAAGAEGAAAGCAFSTAMLARSGIVVHIEPSLPRGLFDFAAGFLKDAA